MKNIFNTTVTIILVLLFLENKTFAQKQNEYDEQEVKVVKENSYVTENSSAHNRMKQKMVFSMEIGGIAPIPLWFTGSNRHGFDFGYYLNRNNLLHFDIRTINSLDNNWFGIKANALGIHDRIFEGNSFFYDFGGEFIKYSFVDKVQKTSETYAIQNSFNGEAIRLSFHIGNQWSWQNLTIACQWIGFTSSIYSRTSNKYFDNSYNDAESRLKSNQNIFEAGNLDLLNITAGIAF